MEREKAKAVLEAILFTLGDSVEIGRLAEVIEESKNVTKELLEELKQSYQAQDKGIELIELEDAVQLGTKNEMYEYLIKIAKTPRYHAGNPFYHRLQAAGDQAGYRKDTGGEL